MVDYRRFLNASQEQVLPYLGGQRVAAEGRDLRLAGAAPEAHGWYRWQVKGREATALGPTDPPDLSSLPVVSGHRLGGDRLVSAEGRVEVFHLPPEDEPAPVAPLTCRRWHSGALLFDMLVFEGEAEEQVRQALDDDRPLGERKGIASSLRAAYAYTLIERVAQSLGIPVHPLEVRPHVQALSAEGAIAAERVLSGLALQRLAARPVAPPLGASAFGRASNERIARAAAALEAAGAELIRARQLQGGSQLEVLYRFQATRFLTIVDAETLNVLDAGVCLDGADGEVTLESLPAVLREAIDTGQLVITAHVSDDD